MRATMTASDREVTVTVRGRARRYASLRTAVLHHNQLRQRSGKGGSQWPTWFVECEGERYYISYNGRVWAGTPQEWTPETTEVEVTQ